MELHIQMSTDIVESAVSSIDTKLQFFYPDPFDQCIFRVPNQLRNILPSSYDPQIIAIGPYHHGKHHLNPMEEHKTRYLQMLLRRRNEGSSRRYIEAMAKIVDKARRYYEKSIDEINSKELVEMMVLDGCFVIEVIRKNCMDELRNLDADDPIFKTEMILFGIKHDLLLLENQLPYFLLQNLFDMTVMPNDEKQNFLEMIPRFFSVLPGRAYRSQEKSLPEKIKHLLGLLHDNWLPPSAKLSNYTKEEKENRGVRSATKLREAGVKFKKDEGANLFDIKFEKCVLHIPQLSIDDWTESVFRNFIAYEQLSNQNSPDHVIDYCIFMDSLINTSTDVDLLSKSGIIKNWLGNDEAVADIFNRICDNVVPSDKFGYSEVCRDVKEHCSSIRHEWMAKLKHDYFNTPWALISFIAAFFLLVFTLLQTLYSILSYYKPDSSQPPN